MLPITRRRALASLAALAGSGLASRNLLGQTAPGPLSPEAVTSDWTSFLGPTHNGVSPETRLRRDLPPDLVWESPKGTGYSSPAVIGNRLVLIHRVGNEEVVECLDAETGARLWLFRYPTAFSDRYGYNNGPRSSPVIDAGRVYTVGAEAKMYCLTLDEGEPIWTRDMRAGYGVVQDFFGTGSTPLIEGGLLVVNVGGQGGPTVVGFDKETGEEVWRAGTEWGPSYASPVPATVHGERRIFVFAGGESDPPTGGLMSIDPATGEVDFEFPWRSRTYESVNASCPVVFGDRVFISATYRTGSALVRVREDFSYEVLWTSQDFDLHFSTAIYRDGYLYGFDGRNEGDASLACLDASDGRVVWQEIPEWVETTGGRQEYVSTYRACLTAVDGAYLVLGEIGHLLWMDLSPQGYEEIARTRLFAARESWTPPVLSRGLLYVTQNGRDYVTGTPPRLICYDMRA